MLADFFNEILHAVTKYGGVVRYWFVTFAFILISGSEDIEVENRNIFIIGT